jgi:tetratricopeptide (TPR) repeat protein
LAKLYGKMGDLRKGIEHFKLAIKYKKDFANGYLFMAKAYLDLGENLDEAVSLAKEGLKLDPESEYAPLGHYILADVYNRLGRWVEYSSELQKAKELEQRIKKKG